MIKLFWKLHPKIVTKLVNMTVNKRRNQMEMRLEGQDLVGN